MRGTVALEQVGGGERMVDATVRLDPPDAAIGSEWFMGTAWQGGGFTTEPLEEVSPGVYRTTEPLPVSGTWKAMIRLHDGRSLTALPVFFPRDDAIPAPEIPATASFTRECVTDHELLQREQKDGVPSWLSAAAYGTVLSITLAFLARFAWAVHRIGPREAPDASPRRSRQHGDGASLRRADGGRRPLPRPADDPRSAAQAGWSLALERIS